jgi:hypothetical protein
MLVRIGAASATPDEMKAFLTTLPATGNLRASNTACTALAEAWAKENPATNWPKLQSLPPHWQLPVGQRMLITWLGQDETAASTIMNTLPAGPLLDEGIDRLVARFRASDPLAAALWTLRYAEPIRQKERLRDVMSEWRQEDPAAAFAAEKQLPVAAQALLHDPR